jgi:uncharacterized membrane protein
MTVKSMEPVARACVLAGVATLFFAVSWRMFASGVSVSACAWTLVLTAPLWIPLAWLLRRNRKTYAIFTLCVIPYLIAGLTEAVANPTWRDWAALVICVSFVLFASLIAYLRITRPVRSQ